MLVTVSIIHGVGCQFAAEAGAATSPPRQTSGCSRGSTLQPTDSNMVRALFENET